MKLEEFDPEKYHRTLEITTRPMRENETQMWDYEFMTPHEYKMLLDNNEMFETVEYQFYPAQYGARYSEIKDDKWNVVVASIEGFLSSLNNLGDNATHVLVNILNDCQLDIAREGRDPKSEERLNLSVLKNIANSDNLSSNQKIYYADSTGETYFTYYEINLSDLKVYRNDRDTLLDNFGKLLSYAEGED